MTNPIFTEIAFCYKQLKSTEEFQNSLKLNKKDTISELEPGIPQNI